MNAPKPHLCAVFIITVIVLKQYNRFNSLNEYLLIGSLGWKSTSLTLPLWPGSLYNILRVLASQIYTNLSAEPAETFEPSGDHAHRNKFYKQNI